MAPFDLLQAVADGEGVALRRQLRARGVAQRDRHAARANSRRVAPGPSRRRTTPAARHLRTPTITSNLLHAQQRHAPVLT